MFYQTNKSEAITRIASGDLKSFSSALFQPIYLKLFPKEKGSRHLTFFTSKAKMK